MMHGIQIKR